MIQLLSGKPINTCLVNLSWLHQLLNRVLQNGMFICQNQLTWYDFWTGKRFTGGQTIKTAAPQDKIPLFVKAGSIVPMGKLLQYTSEKPMDTLEIRIYPGADGQFTLYNDEGDNYNYEKGKYTVIPFKWNEATKNLPLISSKVVMPEH